MASEITAEHAATWAKRLLAGAGLAYAAHQIWQLRQGQHAQISGANLLSSGAVAASSPVAASSAAATTVPVSADASLFPQLFPSASVPGLSLYRRRWLVSRPKALVFLVHGFGEHCGRYEGLVAHLNELGANVYAMDHQGHGQSGGDRAYVQSFDHYTLDVLSFVERTQLELMAEGMEQMPCFLYGHSMGGLIATHVMIASYTPPASADADADASSSASSASAAAPSSSSSSLVSLQQSWRGRLWPWTGCILSAPALVANPHDATPLMLSLSGFLSAHLPKLQLIGLDSNFVSRDPRVVAHYDADPLNWHGRMRARWGSEMLRAMSVARESFASIAWPVLILQGTGDRLVHAPGASIMYEALPPSTDKTIKIFEGGYHELLNDSTAPEALETVTAWITQRMGEKK